MTASLLQDKTRIKKIEGKLQTKSRPKIILTKVLEMEVEIVSQVNCKAKLSKCKQR